MARASASPVTPVSLTTDECAREPIHIPGGIQPHGYLLSIDEAGVIVQFSENCMTLLPEQTATSSLLGMPVSVIIGELFARAAVSVLPELAPGVPRFIGALSDAKFGPAGKTPTTYAVSIHRNDAVIIIELEVATSSHDVLGTVYPMVESFLTGLQSASTTYQLVEIAARQIHKIAGFGRTLIYRFDELGHGHVLAEAANPGYPSYLNQRFPASDIPAQARELYKKNRIRLIADVDYTVAPLVPQRHPATGLPTDLTYAALRSVSPVHLQYMRNMQTDASMSMSIVVDGELWGLISCHDDAPRFPSFEVRSACAQIAQILSLQITAKEMQAADKYRLELRHILTSLLASMANSESFVDGLVSDATDLLAFTASSGAAIVFEGRIHTVGSTPGTELIKRLADWLDRQADDVYACDEAACVFPELAGSSEWAGFLAVSVSRIYHNYVIWFRPEVIRTIEWAGNPHAKTSAASLSPRQSFDSWTDTVRGRSLQWLRAEIEIALEFRTALLSIILRRAEAMAQLALELTRANHDLEGFSYSVSHDLRAPLRHIVGFADIIKRMDDEQITGARARNYIDRIIAAATLGGKLVDDLLAFAQMGRSALHPDKVDVGMLVKTLAASDQLGKEAKNVAWQFDEMSAVEADPAFLQIAFANLLQNAVKFSSTQPAPAIKVGSYAGSGDLNGQEVFYVQDNGVGFDMRYADKLFGVFQRLHPVEEFEGTGIGLANVQRIIERHGGSVWAEAKVDEGATFFLSLPHTLSADINTRHETPAAAMARLAATGQLTEMDKDENNG